MIPNFGIILRTRRLGGDVIIPSLYYFSTGFLPAGRHIGMTMKSGYLWDKFQLRFSLFSWNV